MTLSGRANDYAVKPARNKWNYGQRITCADCGCVITNGHERCRSCARRHREMSTVTIPDERYLKPIPDGYVLIWYPGMAKSERGKESVRRQVRRRLRRYFARREPKPAARAIHPLVHAAWKELAR